MIKDISKLLDKVYHEIKFNADMVCCGMSGGIDSTLCAILCREAIGKENVIGVHMPYSQKDVDTFNNDSHKIASYLGINSTDNILIYKLVELMNWKIHYDGCFSLGEKYKPKLTDVNIGNSKARIRMCILYGITHHLETVTKKRVRVINTCNLSENFIGYESKFGDGAGDFSIIGDLYKSEVYQLADYFKEQNIIIEEMINRIPSAGLEDGQTDEGDFGFTYDDLEKSIREIKEKDYNYMDLVLRGGRNVNISPITKKVISMYERNKHKNLNIPTVSLREFCE